MNPKKTIYETIHRILFKIKGIWWNLEFTFSEQDEMGLHKLVCSLPTRMPIHMPRHINTLEDSVADGTLYGMHLAKLYHGLQLLLPNACSKNARGFGRGRRRRVDGSQENMDSAVTQMEDRELVAATANRVALKRGFGGSASNRSKEYILAPRFPRSTLYPPPHPGDGLVLN